MNRGGARQATFLDDGDYQAFLDTLAEVHRLWGIDVFALPCLSSYAERKSVPGYAPCGWDLYPTIQSAPSPGWSRVSLP
jgi:hypothetical protein